MYTPINDFGARPINPYPKPVSQPVNWSGNAGPLNFGNDMRAYGGINPLLDRGDNPITPLPPATMQIPTNPQGPAFNPRPMPPQGMPFSGMDNSGMQINPGINPRFGPPSGMPMQGISPDQISMLQQIRQQRLNQMQQPYDTPQWAMMRRMGIPY